GAVPWVLLQAVGTDKGPTGGTVFANTTFIQRLNTSGGVAPATGGSQPSNVGATALVPYTADYFFYKADKANGGIRAAGRVGRPPFTSQDRGLPARSLPYIMRS